MTATESRVTVEEIVIARLAREFDGEKVTLGSTVCGEVAIRLAKRLYAPDLVLVGGNSTAAWDCDVGPKVLNDEFVGMTSARVRLDWRQVFHLVAQGKLAICLGPVQLDATGNSNISVVGAHARPKVQLIGARGVPDDMWGVHRFVFHMTSHTPRTVVERVDFVCGRGTDRGDIPGTPTTGLPGVLVSPLGVFDWETASGRMRVQSIHPGVDPDLVAENTGFKLEGLDTAPTTALPTDEELHLIRTEIDPLGMRRLEAAGAPADLFAELVAAELELLPGLGPDDEGARSEASV